MLPSLRWLLPALIAGLLGLTTPASAFAAHGVRDEAGLFSKDAVEKANKKIEEIKRVYDRDLLIETFAKIPDNLQKDYEKDKKDFFERWAQKRYTSEGVRGVYVLICKDPGRFFVEMDRGEAKKAFTRENQRVLRDKLGAHLKAGKLDQALLDTVDYVERTFETNIGKASGSTAGRAKTLSSPSNANKNQKSEIWGWICIGLVAILALWLVFGLIRAFTGGGARPAGGGGYGPGGGGGPGGPGGGYGPGGGGGGGGGGFMSSLLGGMLGAGAGMYLYDSFFRSSTPSSSGWGSSASAADPTSSPEDRTPVSGGDGGGDWGGGNNNGAGGGDTGGGDWGASGGDDSGGGGDWGASGGDDSGGGGDWGGGDAGGGGDGGGGGDW